MESKLCANCFADLEAGGGQCPVCGWDNDKPQPQEALDCYTVVASRYQIGRVKAMNGALHGRGGGRSGFAQGSVQADEASIRDFFNNLS